MVECARLGHVLLSHLSDWNLVTEEGFLGPSHCVVVEVGLEKLSDRHGVPFASPERVLDPVLVNY